MLCNNLILPSFILSLPDFPRTVFRENVHFECASFLERKLAILGLFLIPMVVWQPSESYNHDQKSGSLPAL